MASAYGGQQEPGGSQQAVPDGPQVPDGGQQSWTLVDPQMPQDAGQQEPGGSQLAVPDGPPMMPGHITIGTKSAFRNNYAYPYEKKEICSETCTETIYVCEKGNEGARESEVLVLRDVEGTWTAFDSGVSADGRTLHCRQAVFRCPATNPTQAGWHEWETNWKADRHNPGLEVEWHRGPSAETRVPVVDTHHA